MSHLRFGVLILNLDGSRWLPGLYDSLRADGYANKRVYLVDNGSTDASQQLTRERYPEVALLQMPRNLGYSAAYNTAVETAFADGCDWVVWQNNDTLVLPGWLDRMAAAATVDPRIGVMGPVFRDWASDEPSPFMRKRHPDLASVMEDVARPPVDVDWVEGSACAVRQECLRETGPLDTDLFMYWEEADFCRRARHHGWRVVIVPGSIVRHFGGGTAGGPGGSNRFNPLKTRNQYVYKLCDPGRSLAVNLLATVRLFLVSCRMAMRTGEPAAAVWRNVKTFAWFVAGLPRWCGKWARDRRHARRPRQSVEPSGCVRPIGRRP